MAVKRLNKNVVISLTLFVFVMSIVTAVLLIRRVQQRDPKYFVDLARQYETSGEWQSAAAFYKKAWDRSRDPSYLVPLGDALLADGQVGDAVNAWRTALIDDPTSTEAHVRLIDTTLELSRLYGRGDDWKLVREAVTAFLASDAARTPAQEALAHRATGLARSAAARPGDADAALAEEALRNATMLDPATADAAIDLAEHLVRQGRLDEAEELLRSLLAQHTGAGGESSKVRLAYGRFLSSRNDFAGAEKQFQESMTAAGDDPKSIRDARLGYALFLSQQWARAVRDNADKALAQRLFEQSESILRQTIESDPDEYDGYLQLALLYGTARRHQDVERVCESRLQRGLSRKGLQAIRNRLSAFTLMIYASEACLSEALAAGQADRPDEKERLLQRAEAYVASARGEIPTHPRIHGQSGRVKLARGLEREAIRDLRAAAEAYRQAESVNWETTITLARLHLRLNEAGAARAVLEEVLETARRDRGADVSFWTLYAQVLFQNDESDHALAICDQVLLADARQPDALRLKAAIFERQGRVAEAGRMYEQLTGDRVVRSILTARQMLLDGRTEEALATLTAAVKEDPADPRLVSAAVRELLNLKRRDEADEIVRRSLAIAPDNPALQRLAVLTRGDLTDEERSRSLQDIILQEEDAFERALQLVGLRASRTDYAGALSAIDDALAHLAAKDTPAAKTADPGQFHGLLWAKMSIAGTLGDSDALAAARDEAARSNVDGVGGRAFLGLYHMHRKEFDLAVRALQEATSALPTDSRSWSHLGFCLQSLGRADEAQSAFEQAVKANPSEAIAHRGLAALAKSRGDRAAYEHSLTVCERLIPNDPWVAAELALRAEQGDPHEAIARREALLQTAPDDVENLKRLATLSEAAGDRDRADRYCRRLLELRPDDREVASVAAAYFRRTGRPDQALQVVDRQVAARPAGAEKAAALMLRARHFLDTRNLEEAERSLEQAAREAQTLEVVRGIADFHLRAAGQPEKALGWLEKAVELARAERSPQLPAMMASRIACLLDRRINDTAAAGRYVDELSAAFPAYTQALLLRSEVQSRSGHIVAAVDSLSEYLRQSPDDIHALYQRALHRVALGRSAEAIADLELVKRISPLGLDLQPRLLLARLHQFAGRKDQWLHELAALAADSANADRPVEELLKAYLQQERLAEAERVATAQINRTGAQPTAQWYFWRGQIAVQSGDAAKALADLHRGAELSGFKAEAVAQVLAAHARLGRAPEGIEYYHRYVVEERTRPFLYSGLGVLYFRAGKRSEAMDQFRLAMRAAMAEGPAIRASVLADFASVIPDARTQAETIAQLEQPPADPALKCANDSLLVESYRLARRPADAATRLEAWIATCAQPPQRAEAMNLLGNLRHAAGDGTGARQAYEDALKSNPDDWITLNNLAYLLFDRFGDAALARPHAEKAVALADNADTLDTLGWILVGLGDHRRAIAELSRAVRLNPSAALSYFHLGEAFRRAERFDEASAILAAGREVARVTGDTSSVDSCTSALERAAKADANP